MLYLDLDELPALFDPYLLWSARRSAIAQYRRSDHFGNEQTSMSTCVRDLVEKYAGDRPSGPIRLLTHLRYFGYCMNPVSFFFCWDSTGSRLEHVVAEVSNTPWREQHCYVLSPVMYETNNSISFHTQKEFHVSPFLPMDLEYSWHFTGPDDALEVGIEASRDGNKQFSANLHMAAEPISKTSLSRCLRQYPFMTATVIRGIHWQAVRLWLKRSPFYRHPKHDADVNRT